MFGKAQWFRKKKYGWGLVPVTVQGWMYTGVCLAVVTLPFAAFLLRQQAIEAGVWMGATVAFLAWEVRQMRRTLMRTGGEENTFYIGEEETEAERMATRNFDFQLRR